MRARLQTHINRTVFQQRLVFHGSDSIHLGMRLPTFPVKSLTDNTALMHNHRTNHRIRTDISPPSFGQLDATSHVFLFNLYHNLCI